MFESIFLLLLDKIIMKKIGRKKKRKNVCFDIDGTTESFQESFSLQKKKFKCFFVSELLENFFLKLKFLTASE